MKNYLEHEELVRLMDGVFSYSQEWKWFIILVESSFDLEDVRDYEEFEKRRAPLTKLIDYFDRIVSVCNAEWECQHETTRDIICLARYNTNNIGASDCWEKIDTALGKLFFVSMLLTKYENAVNSTQYVLDMRFFTMSNLHQLVDMKQLDVGEAFTYLQSVNLEGFDRAKKCVSDNLNQVSYDLSEGFFDRYKDILLSPNVFSFQHVDRERYLPWQEQMLLDMTNISITNGKIIPVYSNANTLIPDYSCWSSDLLANMKSFFRNPIADFVIESIDYIKNDVAPSGTVIDEHCRLLTELVEGGDVFEICSSSSYYIVSRLFKNKDFDNSHSQEHKKKLLEALHQSTDINLIRRMDVDGLPLNREQSVLLKEYFQERYRSILGIGNLEQLIVYLQETDSARYISDECFETLIDVLSRVFGDYSNPRIPLLFHYSMRYLQRIKSSNQTIDKQRINSEMIRLQELWQREAYGVQLNQMTTFVTKVTKTRDQVEKLNELILENPIGFARASVVADEGTLIKLMEEISKRALAYLPRRMILSSFFPIVGLEVCLENHDIDSRLKEWIDKINREKAYKFINHLEAPKYVWVIHEKCIENLRNNIHFFDALPELYSRIADYLEVKLLPYGEVYVGHLTQLFPLLEVKIRELGKLFGVVPFVMEGDTITRLKEPSMVLRDILLNVFDETGSWENVPDLLFVYQYLYNSNSLNIRNESVHGCNYLSGDNLSFAFSVTLISLHMILCRIDFINEVMSSLSQEENT